MNRWFLKIKSRECRHSVYKIYFFVIGLNFKQYFFDMEDTRDELWFVKE